MSPSNPASAIDTLKTLETWFASLKGTVTAFSGGVDSALVLYLSRRYLGRDKGIGCISDSPSLKRSDLQIAKDFCNQHDIRLEIIQTKEIEDEDYASNPPTRCFACKSHLYQDMQAILAQFPEYTLLNGTNSDDLGDYRPGLQAAKDHHARSPLAENSIGKDSVRSLAQHFGLKVWDKPASPCLSSRIPYGQRVTRDKLSRIEAAETILQNHGFQRARVRHFENEARIEVEASSIERLQSNWTEIASQLLELGFPRCTLDPEGFVSGKLNRSLPKS